MEVDMRNEKNIIRFLTVLLTFGLVLITNPAGTSAQTKSIGQSVKQRYDGNITYIGGPRGSVVTQFTLRINSLTPQQDVDRYMAELKRGGQDALMDAIRGSKRGTVQVGTQLARDANAIWVTDEGEGKKITILFERWLGFGELRRGARSVDYPFTYVEIFIDEKGRGEGTLIPAARVRYKSNGTIEFENFGIYPARLTNLK